jgi:serine protease Do
MGLAFAIPIDVAMDVANQLKAGGKVSRGWLGVVIQEVSKDLAESFGLSKPAGALVSNVEKNSPADKAGIEVSDVIQKFDGKAVESSSDLPRLVGATKAGKKVAVQVWRKGAAKELMLTVGDMPAEKIAQSGRSGGKSAKAPTNRLGLALSELSEAQLKELKISHGLLVEDVEGQAARVGIQRNDVIMSLNNKDVKTLEQFNQLLAQYKPGNSFALLVRRGNNALFVPLRME